MSLFYIVGDNLGHIILNYLDCEDMYSIICNKYTNILLTNTNLLNRNIKLTSWWRDLLMVESRVKEEEAFDKYLNSEEFWNEIKDFIT